MPGDLLGSPCKDGLKLTVPDALVQERIILRPGCKALQVALRTCDLSLYRRLRACISLEPRPHE